MKTASHLFLFGSELNKFLKLTYGRKTGLVLIIILSLFILSCRKNFVPHPKKVIKPTSTKELTASSNFSWGTTRSFDFEIKPAKKGLLLIQDEKANVIYKALLLPNEAFYQNLTVASSLTKINVYFNGNKEEIILPGQGIFISKLQ